MVGTSVYRCNALIAHDKTANVATFLLNEFLNIKNGVVITAQQGFMQKFVEKKGRDIRSFVVGDECIAAIYRSSDHWITNTARGAAAAGCEVTTKIADISLAAANAVGGGVLAVDLFENDGEFSVNEVNYTMEFRNSIETTGVNIPARVVDFTLRVDA